MLAIITSTGAQIETVNTDGTVLTQFKGLPDFAASATFSRDGSLIAFSAPPSGPIGPSQVWVARSDGSSAYQLTDVPDGALEPTWSPDGKQLAVTTGTHTAIVVVNADGTGGKQVTPTVSAYTCYAPDW